MGEHMMDIHGIQVHIPHRHPFLLVDRILEIEKGRRIVGIKNVTMNEPFFAGHFPGRPIMPGVLLIEGMAQVGGVLWSVTIDAPEQEVPRYFYFAGIDKVKFRRPVYPGDQIRYELEIMHLKRRICKMKGFAYVDGQLVVEAELLSVLADQDE
ncbi:MAG: 3-hydroxyacyl-ACP dehydratase FabZ [Candidatus Methylomirabilales bacterium]